MKKLIKMVFSVFIIAIIAVLSACNKTTEDSKNEDQYTVTFYINSDELSEVSFKYDKNTKLELDSILSDIFKNVAPTKNGYEEYSGEWFLDSSYSSTISFPYTLSGDLSLYLKWELIEVNLDDALKVTYYVDNEEVGYEYVKEGELANGIDAPNKEGYSFNGWYTNKTLTSKYDFSKNVTKNIKLFGGYSIKSYDVEFINGVNNSTISTQNVKYNSTANKPIDPVLSHYEFNGWYIDSSYSTEFDFSKVIKENTKVYAKFSPVETVTVEFLDKDGNTVAEKQIVDKNSYAIKPNNPSKLNHTFDGWYTDLEFTDEFEFTNKITSNTKVYAKFNYFELSETEITVTKSGGYNEGAYVEFTKLANTYASDYSILYKINGSNTSTEIDSELIRENDLTVRADILGLKPGTYTITIKSKNTTITKEISNIVVTSQDRSGYAHFNNSTGVGAYNNDGTLKSNAVVVYVNDSNKNTVTATLGGKTYTGLVKILQAQNSSNYPLVIRLIGRIGAATWNPITYNGSSLSASSITGANGSALNKTNMTEDQIISNGYNSLNTTTASKLNNLTNRIKYSNNEFDSYFNMLDVSSANNVTIEGVGVDAEIFQWGFTWSKCNSIEVRNLTFTDYPEDACSFQGGSNSDVNTYGNYWVHNNVFNKGKNYWDVTYEQDKPAGDGATDFKFCNSITSCYNKFNNCKKTGLVGGSNSNYTKNVTFHHNYYNAVGSRLPLGRQANMHIYNNYYYKCGTAQDIRANAFVLSEANYFEECDNPQKVTPDDTYQNPVIKSYGDYLTGCGESKATVVTSRTASLTGNCKPDGATNYTNFDTNSSLFYYDSVNQKSNVSLLTDATQAKYDCINLAGVLTGSSFTANNNSNSSSSNNTDNETNNNENSNNDSSLVTSSSNLSLNSFSEGDITTSTTKNGLTINPKSGKTCAIYSCDKTLNSTSVTKYINLGGAGSFDELSIKFTTTKAANITVYYGSGSEGRKVKLMTSDNSTEASTTTTKGGIVNYTFSNCSANTYSVASTNSGIDIYLIVIEYTE